MLDLKTGKKIEVKGAHFLMEIKGVYPKAQPFIANFTNEEVINVAIDGITQPFKRRVLEKIVESMIPEVKVEQDDNLEPENIKNKKGVIV